IFCLGSVLDIFFKSFRIDGLWLVGIVQNYHYTFRLVVAEIHIHVVFRNVMGRFAIVNDRLVFSPIQKLFREVEILFLLLCSSAFCKSILTITRPTSRKVSSNVTIAFAFIALQPYFVTVINLRNATNG